MVHNRLTLSQPLKNSGDLRSLRTGRNLYYIVEADDYDTVEKFLCPGFKRCTATITPVSQFFGK